MKLVTKLLLKPITLGVLMTVPTVALSSGFALIEQSASGQGLSYAGAAASTEDASVMWFNPAGLSDIEGHQVIVGAHLILPSVEFYNEGSEITLSGPLYGKTDNGSESGALPNLYWKGQIGEYDLGLGLNVPYGSTVSYDQDWVGRYHAVYTQTKTINFNPSVSRKFGNLSLGGGLNAQYIDVTLTSKIDLGASSGDYQQQDGYAELQADGWGFGYNLGVLYQFENKAKLGVSYRSGMTHSPEGQADFTVLDDYADDPSYDDTGLTATVSLPAVASFSLDYPVNDQWKVLADATWMGWSSFDELRIEFDSGRNDSVQPEEWGDVWRYALGTTYQVNSDFVLRMGVAIDYTPIPDKTLRTPRIADSDRKWLSFGAGYDLSKTLHLDVAYSRLWGGQPEIEATHAELDTHVLKGYFDIQVDILSAQLVWNY